MLAYKAYLVWMTDACSGKEEMPFVAISVSKREENRAEGMWKVGQKNPAGSAFDECVTNRSATICKVRSSHSCLLNDGPLKSKRTAPRMAVYIDFCTATGVWTRLVTSDLMHSYRGCRWDSTAHILDSSPQKELVVYMAV